jgi:hypothetical protein
MLSKIVLRNRASNQWGGKRVRNQVNPDKLQGRHYRDGTN